MPEESASDLKRHLIGALVLYAALVLLVFAHQVRGNGALASPHALAGELHGTSAETPWTLGEKLPYNYRPLFRTVVLGIYGLFTPDLVTFYWLFVAASALCMLFAVGAFHGLLRELEFSPQDARLGGVLFLLGFPILFSHDMPIHTREDLLGYAWISLTLIAVKRDNPWAVALLGVVGAGIRETCLLGVLPYFFVSQRAVWIKALVYAVPGAAWLILRRIQNPTGESYAYFGVSLAPTLEFPVEALLYAFAAFGALWVAAGMRLAQREAPRHPLLAPRIVALALASVVLTGWTMGMIREARITYVLFPFVIPLAIEFLRSERAAALARVPIARLAAGGVIAAGVLGLALLAANPIARVGVVNPATNEVVPEGSLRTYIGTSFNPGVSPVLEIEGYTITNTFASPFNGPHVLIHLALAVGLLVGAGQLRAGSEPE